MHKHINITSAKESQRGAIFDLLTSESLPVTDLPEELSGFFIATDNGMIVGVIGLQPFGNNGLLRSLVVKPEYRRFNTGATLVTTLEDFAMQCSLTSLYLLTETATSYFIKKGYSTITRAQVPDAIQQSAQFKGVCPANAVVMVKKLSTR